MDSMDSMVGKPTNSTLDLYTWFDNYVKLNEYIVNIVYKEAIYDGNILYMCNILVTTQSGTYIDTSKSIALPNKKSALRHAKFVHYNKHHDNILCRSATNKFVSWDQRVIGRPSIITLIPTYCPCNGEKSFNIVDAESVPIPSRVVIFNGPIVYFCTLLAVACLKHRIYDEVDCLGEFELRSDSNACIIDKSMSEIVDHYISVCAIYILKYCDKNNIKHVTISSVDMSAKCTVYIMRRFVAKYKMDICIYLLGRSIYMDENGKQH